MPIYEDLAEAAAAIRERAKGFHPQVGLILGSGLGSFADQFDSAVAIPYGDLPHFPRSSVSGHAGQLVLGSVAGQRVVAMQGRVHFYEGYSFREIGEQLGQTHGNIRHHYYRGIERLRQFVFDRRVRENPGE